MQGGSASSGKRRWWRIDGEDPRRPAMETAMPAALWRVRRAVVRWGGRRGRGGAPGRIGEARGGRWPRGSSSAAAGVFGGCARESQRRRGARGESERPGGVRGVADGVQGDERKQEVARGKQEVAEAASARATPRLCSSSWQRRKRTRGRRWAGPAGGAGPDGALGGAAGKWASLSFFYCSVLFSSVLFYLISFCHCFEFLNKFKQCQKLL